MRELNFRSFKKNYLPVVFEDNTKILVKTPTKGLVERLATLSESLGELEHSANSSEALGTVFELASQVMSNNVGKKEITSDYLEEMLDLQDILMFFDEYTKLIDGINEIKN